MKFFYWLFIFCGANLISYLSYSQINSYPYFQDFESEFLLGKDIQFIPSWNGNDVQTSSRIFKETANAFSGSGALGLIPTSTFSPTITLNLDFSSLAGVKIEFYARSISNGSGTYPAVLEFSVSTDQGLSFSAPEEIGAGAFTNADTPFNLYNYNFPSEVAGQSTVILKIKAKRGSGGSGTTAKIIIDDFKIAEIFTVVREVSFREVQINEIFADPTGTNGPDSLILPNAEFIELFNSGPDTIDLKNLFISGSKIPTFNLLPDSNVVLCPINYQASYSEFGATLGIESWNTLTNGGEKILLADSKGKVIDSLTYNLDWYQDKSKKDGSWSLEQINPYAECYGGYNWKASESPFGATPGSRNSVYKTNIDSTPLTVKELTIQNPYTLEVTFNKPISSNGFSENQIKISPAVEIDSVSFSTYYDRALIALADSIKAGKIYVVKFVDLADCSQLKGSTEEVSFGIGTAPSFNDLIITEIMADPSPVKGLPESEYIEILNRSEKIISLKDVLFSDESSLTTLGEDLILPGEYFILCPSSSLIHFKNIKAIAPSKWLSLTNKGELLSLRHKEELLFSVTYSEDWYRDSEKNEGGFSLEMADVDLTCLEDGNWFASLDELGGTPGKKNSPFEVNPDLLGPSITNIEVINSNSVTVTLDEKLDTLQVFKSNFSMSPSGEIESFKVINPSARKLSLTFTSPLTTRTTYNFEAKDMSDCLGNRKTSSITFAVPETLDSLDVIINEVLFNPRPYGVDFVEVFNKSEKYLNIKGWKLGKIVGGKIEEIKQFNISKSLLKPKEFFVVTPDPEKLINEYPLMYSENVFDMETPAMPDDEGNIALLDSMGRIIDFFQYSEDFHHVFLGKNEGVSLERIFANESTNDKNNWQSASSNAGFATPGYKNSQSQTEFNETEKITILPAVFSPDGDTYNDFVLIKFPQIEPGIIASIKIYDKEGRKIKSLIDNESLSMDAFIKWEGEDDAGAKVKSGIYLVLIEIFSPTGTRKKYKKEVIVASKLQ